jgi:hypothetical protein
MSGTDTEHFTHEKPITYVLAGDDHNGALTDTVEAYKKDKNVVVLSASDYPSIDDAVKQIKPPANIVIACHGEAYERGNATGTFAWAKHDEIGPEYGQLFSQLPGGIGTITVLSCYGETALDMLQDMPAGTVLQSLIGMNAPNLAGFAEMFQEETVKSTDPNSLILEALDNIDATYIDKVRRYTSDDGKVIPLSRGDLLPQIIGIGGNPPIEIDLDKQSGGLGSQITQNPTAFKDAISLVKKHFDTKTTFAMFDALEDTGVSWQEFEASKEGSPERKALETKLLDGLRKKFPDADAIITEKNGMRFFNKLVYQHKHDPQHDLEDKITAVAEKIKNGEPIALDKDGNPDFDELRIRRALGVAYLKTSGEMDKLIEQAKESAKPAEIAPPSKAPENEPSIMSEDKALKATPQQNDYGALLGKYGLSKDDFSNVALDPSTPTYAAYKPQSQSVDTGRTV